jgi:hypothetical protein
VVWITLRNLWSDWRRPLMYVQVETRFIRWQTRTVPKILGAAVESASQWSRSSWHGHRTPPINRTNGRGQSVVARTQDSRRTENARHRHL